MLNVITKGNDLSDAYATILARSKGQKESRSRLRMEALMWVSNLSWPLHTTQQFHAPGVSIGFPDLNSDNIPITQALSACSLGLLMVGASSPNPRLVYFSLRGDMFHNLGLFRGLHTRIAEACLMYLNFRCVRKLALTLSSAPLVATFMGYFSSYWWKFIRGENPESMCPPSTRASD